jgi:hypothetical protein
MRTVGLVGVAVLALYTAGCGASSIGAPSVVTPATRTSAAVRSVSPNLGSTGGATLVRIVGDGLGTSVTFGGVTVTGFVDNLGFLWVYTPAHEAGAVDVVVSTPGGQPVTATRGFTYASWPTVDVNGSWSGYGNNGQDSEILFTIRDNTVLNAKCDDLPGYPGRAIAFSPPLPVTNDEFSFVGGDGAVFSGRIVSSTQATGIIRLGPCASDYWSAEKR